VKGRLDGSCPFFLSAADRAPWDGGRIGGRMGRSNKNKKEREAGKANKAKANNGDQELAEASGENGNGAAKDPAKLGAKKALRRALKDKLNQGGAKKIAEALVDQTAKGEKLGAGILMTLVMNKKDEGGTAKKKKKKRSGPSLADLLASEPEWVEEPAETTVGGREPEDGSN